MYVGIRTIAKISLRGGVVLLTTTDALLCLFRTQAKLEKARKVLDRDPGLWLSQLGSLIRILDRTISIKT